MNLNQYRPTVTPCTVAKARNSAKICCARGCTATRHGLNLFCKPHDVAYRRYGHPTAKPINPANYTPYRALILPVFAANESHPGLVAALDYIAQWLSRATANEKSCKASPEMARLVRAGVSARDVLVEACALWCYTADNPRAVPDIKAENVAISRAVFALAPRPRIYSAITAAKPTQGSYATRALPSALAGCGSVIRAVLSHFLVNVQQAVSTRDARAAATLAALRAPLKSPTAAYLAATESNS